MEVAKKSQESGCTSIVEIDENFKEDLKTWLISLAFNDPVKRKLQCNMREVTKRETPRVLAFIILSNTVIYFKADLEMFHKQCAMQKLMFELFLPFTRLMCVSESFNGSTE